MPVTYAIDVPRAIIRTRCTGQTLLAEVLNHFSELAQDPACPERLSVLLDLSQMSGLPQSSQLHLVADAIRAVNHRVQFDACAIIAPQDAVFGMLRMFSVFDEHYFNSISVFRTAKEAESWLAEECERLAVLRHQRSDRVG